MDAGTIEEILSISKYSGCARGSKAEIFSFKKTSGLQDVFGTNHERAVCEHKPLLSLLF